MSNCRQPGRDARAQAESQAQAIIDSAVNDATISVRAPSSIRTIC